MACDILDMNPIVGVDFLQGDFRAESVLYALFERVGDDWYISQDDFNWWDAVIAKQQQSNDLQAEYLETHSYDELMILLEQVSACDLEDVVAQEIELLQEAINNS